MPRNPVIIAGGGIGGIAAACGLAQKPIASVVLEQTATLGEIGAGIQIDRGAFHCFDDLGIGAQAAVRNHVMSGMTPEQWYDQLVWLYGPSGKK